MAHYILIDTDIGRVGIAWSEQGLVRLRLPERDPHRTEQRLAVSAVPWTGDPPARIAQLIADLRRYAAGSAVDFSAVAIDFAGVAAFDRAVYDALRTVGWGRTTTYGRLAQQAGSSAPEAARDVGQAMAHNPVPIVIPCHRVLAAGDRIGGFSAPGGRFTKERLLALEGVDLHGGQLALPGL